MSQSRLNLTMREEEGLHPVLFQVPGSPDRPHSPTLSPPHLRSPGVVDAHGSWRRPTERQLPTRRSRSEAPRRLRGEALSPGLEPLDLSRRAASEERKKKEEEETDRWLYRQFQRKANEALFRSWPTVRDPASRPGAARKSIEERFRPPRNRAEWPEEHRLEYLRAVGPLEEVPAEPPVVFRPPTLRVAARLPGQVPLPDEQVSRGGRAREGCWWCGEPHQFRYCPYELGTQRFCFRCGTPNVTKRTCPQCSGEWREGVARYWRQGLGFRRREGWYRD